MPDEGTTKGTEASAKAGGSEIAAQVAQRINDAHNVLIALSADPSVDEMAAAIGLSLVLDGLGKRATAIYSGVTPNALKFLKPEDCFDDSIDALQDFVIALNKDKADHLRYRLDGDYVKIFVTPYKSRITEADLEYSYGDFNVDLVLALDVANGADLDASLREHGRIMHDASIVNITTDEPGKLGEIEWSDTEASSVSEMIAGMFYAAGNEAAIGPEEATAFLTGIIAATDRFKDVNTSPGTMMVAAKLMKSGADQQAISENITEAIMGAAGESSAPESAVADAGAGVVASATAATVEPVRPVEENDGTAFDVREEEEHGRMREIEEIKSEEAEESTEVTAEEAAPVEAPAEEPAPAEVAEESPVEAETSAEETVAEAPVETEPVAEAAPAEEPVTETPTEEVAEAPTEETPVEPEVVEEPAPASEEPVTEETSTVSEGGIDFSEINTGGNSEFDVAPAATAPAAPTPELPKVAEPVTTPAEQPVTEPAAVEPVAPEPAAEPAAEPATPEPAPASEEPEHQELGKMLEDAMGNFQEAGSMAETLTNVTPSAQPGENPATVGAPSVPGAPEINGVPEMNFMPMPGEEVLPPPPTPPISMGDGGASMIQPIATTSMAAGPAEEMGGPGAGATALFGGGVPAAQQGAEGLGVAGDAGGFGSGTGGFGEPSGLGGAGGFGATGNGADDNSAFKIPGMF